VKLFVVCRYMTVSDLPCDVIFSRSGSESGSNSGSSRSRSRSRSHSHSSSSSSQSGSSSCSSGTSSPGTDKSCSPHRYCCIFCCVDTGHSIVVAHKEIQEVWALWMHNWQIAGEIWCCCIWVQVVVVCNQYICIARWHSHADGYVLVGECSSWWKDCHCFYELVIDISWPFLRRNSALVCKSVEDIVRRSIT
jgi:hypothetical protein